LIEGTFDKFGVFNPPDESKAYDKITVVPTVNAKLEGNFSTTDITPNDLQIIGTQQPGYINPVSITRNQDVRQGEPINQTFSTNLKITKYKFDGNGTYYMQPDPNAPQTWVIPGAIEVAVQPPQLATNQIVTTNGTYEIYDANPNQPGLEIESGQQQQQMLKLRESGETKENDEEEKEDLIGTFTVNVPTPAPTPTQTKTVTYSNPGTYTVSPDTGYNLSSVTVNVQASQSPIYMGKWDIIFSNNDGQMWYDYHFTIDDVIDETRGWKLSTGDTTNDKISVLYGQRCCIVGFIITPGDSDIKITIRNLYNKTSGTMPVQIESGIYYRVFGDSNASAWVNLINYDGLNNNNEFLSLCKYYENYGGGSTSLTIRKNDSWYWDNFKYPYFSL